MTGMTDTLAQLVQLFREAGSAHHKAFIATNGDDPEWPIWYAEFLHERVNTLLNSSLTRSEVVYLLVRAERERASISPRPDWPEFYAGLFMKEQ